MKIDGFIWVDEIIDEIEGKHGVQQYEVREVFINQPYFRFVDKGTIREKISMQQWDKQMVYVI